MLRLADVPELLVEDGRLDLVEAELAYVPGHGAYGIRTGCLWMLAGSDDLIKPDRMVVGWLTGVLVRTPTLPEARTLLAAVAETLGVTAWQLDHATCNAQRVAAAARRRRTASALDRM